MMIGERWRVNGFERLRGFLRPRDAGPLDFTPIALMPIGVVRSRVRDLRPRVDYGHTAVLELADAHATALTGLDGFSHAIVLTWLDRVSDDERATTTERPGGIQALSPVGVLALRTQHRPNPIGLSVVEVKSVDGSRVTVRGLDVVDGTPVLDIKPYLPPYDSVPDARLPGWATGSPA